MGCDCPQGAPAVAYLNNLLPRDEVLSSGVSQKSRQGGLMCFRLYTLNFLKSVTSNVFLYPCEAVLGLWLQCAYAAIT